MRKVVRSVPLSLPLLGICGCDLHRLVEKSDIDAQTSNVGAVHMIVKSKAGVRRIEHVNGRHQSCNVILPVAGSLGHEIMSVERFADLSANGESKMLACALVELPLIPLTV